MMSQTSTPTLPPFDRKLISVVERLVPLAERKDWSRAWQAELWHMHHRRGLRHRSALIAMADISIGLTRDALWLRTESWRRTFTGTAVLCIASLFGLILVASVITLSPQAGWRSLGASLGQQVNRSLFAAPLILFVAFASASSRHIEQGPQNRGRFWIKQQAFFSAKVVQVLVLAFVLSVDICQPLHPSLPDTVDFFQIFCFVLFALIGLRWAIHDQEQRCKHCLQSLATPARVGRPSHNLLEWNGTELSCKRGHGLLSIPEMETSWCQSSRWIVLEACRLRVDEDRYLEVG
jgi:hypothetical protein